MEAFIVSLFLPRDRLFLSYSLDFSSHVFPVAVSGNGTSWKLGPTLFPPRYGNFFFPVFKKIFSFFSPPKDDDKAVLVFFFFNRVPEVPSRSFLRDSPFPSKSNLYRGFFHAPTRLWVWSFWFFFFWRYGPPPLTITPRCSSPLAQWSDDLPFSSVEF